MAGHALRGVDRAPFGDRAAARRQTLAVGRAHIDVPWGHVGFADRVAEPRLVGEWLDRMRASGAERNAVGRFHRHAAAAADAHLRTAEHGERSCRNGACKQSPELRGNDGSKLGR